MVPQQPALSTSQMTTVTLFNHHMHWNSFPSPISSSPSTQSSLLPSDVRRMKEVRGRSQPPSFSNYIWFTISMAERRERLMWIFSYRAFAGRGALAPSLHNIILLRVIETWWVCPQAWFCTAAVRCKHTPCRMQSLALTHLQEDQLWILPLSSTV